MSKNTQKPSAKRPRASATKVQAGRAFSKKKRKTAGKNSVIQVVEQVKVLAGTGGKKTARAGGQSAEDVRIKKTAGQIESLEGSGESSSLIGSVDDLKDGVLYGWALGDPEKHGSARVKVIVDGRQVAEGTADCFRQDLLDAGIGSGFQSFKVELPWELFDNSFRELTVIVNDSVELPNKYPMRRFESVLTEEKTSKKVPKEEYLVLFDASYYLGQLPDIVESPLGHYLEFGWKLNLNPHPLFDTRYYLALYGSEVLTNPLHHFLTIGRYREYEVHPIFDVARYSKRRPDVRAESMHPVLHYLEFGHKENVNFSEFFDEVYYETECPGVRDHGIIPVVHYLSFGWKETRRPHREFDTSLFRRLQSGYTEQELDPYTEFLRDIRIGKRAGRVGKGEKSETPKVSVIILNLSKTITTLCCLHQLRRYTDQSQVEVIIVDNGSREDQFQLLCELATEENVIRLSRNTGFGEGNNIGADRARGEYLVFLNNDAFVPESWIENLLSGFDLAPNVGAVGPKFVYPDGRLQEAGAFISADGTAYQRGKNLDPSAEVYNKAEEVDYISAATLVVRRELFTKVLGFDLCWDPAYYEDADLCLKLKLIGYSTVYMPEVEVIHVENGTSSDPKLALGLNNVVEINRLKFIARWQEYILNGSDAVRSDLFNCGYGEATLTGRPQAALYSPYPLIPGGGERYLLTLASELRANFDVTFFVPEECSSFRISTMARELNLNVSDLRVRRWENRSAHGPFSLFVCMGNQILPPVPGIGLTNIFHCQFPFPMDSGHFTRDWGNLNGYACIIVNSDYTRRHVEDSAQRLGLNCPPVHIVHPPVPGMESSQDITQPNDGVIRILNVGRFAPGGHCKRQDVMIDVLRNLRKKFPKIRLDLAGSIGFGSESRVYLANLRKESRDLPVRFHVNPAPQLLAQLYRDAQFYWHLTGIGLNPTLTPEYFEHFGISIVEAMSARCIPFAVRTGGPKEIISDSYNGFLLDTKEDLRRDMEKALSLDREELDLIAKNAESLSINFRPSIFSQRIAEVLELISAGQMTSAGNSAFSK